MKKKQTVVITIALLFLATFSGAAFANFKGNHHRMPGPPPFHHRGGDGLMMLTWDLHKNMMVQVLSQMTKQPATTIQKELKEEHLPKVLAKYKIDRKALFQNMHDKTVALIKDFAQKGYITAEQAEHIQKRMEWRAKRHELMLKLVENGVKNGTITQDQARMLLHHRR